MSIFERLASSEYWVGRPWTLRPRIGSMRARIKNFDIG
jgi:hypothetical protein